MSLIASLVILNSNMPVIDRHVDYNQIVISISAFIIMVLYLTVKLLFKDYYYHLFINVFRVDVSGKELGETSAAGNQASLLTEIASILSVGTALMTSLVYFGEIGNVVIKPAVMLLITTSASLGLVLFYKISLAALGWILDIKEVTKQYSEMTSDIFRVLGIIIFPIFLILPFSDLWLQNILIFSIIAIASVSVLVRVYGFFNFLIKIKFFNHYAILYFCIFEILPLLYIAHFVGKLSV